MVGSALGLCTRALTANEKAVRIADFMDFTKVSRERAVHLLKLSQYDVPSAVKNWIGIQNGVDLVSDDDADTTVGKGAPAPPSHGLASCDVSRTMYRSSYGSIMKIIKRITTLANATTLELPTIVVIGSESAGKSSTLERIAGMSLFPRDARICTRSARPSSRLLACPLCI